MAGNRIEIENLRVNEIWYGNGIVFCFSFLFFVFHFYFLSGVDGTS